MASKKLYRSYKNKMICGVCGGIGEYLGVDPTVIRILAVILACAGTAGIVAYIVGAIIIPPEPWS
ncbi:MAG TPA: PspC domain-containing protein [Candidatus Onthocola gallistercoris]|uniref:PspC domain-containing protein n=1 Tax=Candidatus Onthocola gallistercoris TaxID=2840876 RepID=A0A9D1HEK7_9FIRM|nr:PspC domain-containing protein [Candidatus Onthocola gallistercoris]